NVRSVAPDQVGETDAVKDVSDAKSRHAEHEEAVELEQHVACGGEEQAQTGKRRPLAEGVEAEQNDARRFPHGAPWLFEVQPLVCQMGKRDGRAREKEQARRTGLLGRLGGHSGMGSSVSAR